MKANIKMTAVFEAAEEGGYIGYIDELPGVNTQGETLDETKSNLIEALQLVLETQRELSMKASYNKKLIRETLYFA